MLVLVESPEMPLSVYMALFSARGSFGSSESFFFGWLRHHISFSVWWRKRKKKWEKHRMREITKSAAQKFFDIPWLQLQVDGHSCESAWPGWESDDHKPTCIHGQKHLMRKKHRMVNSHRTMYSVWWKYLYWITWLTNVDTVLAQCHQCQE